MKAGGILALESMYAYDDQGMVDHIELKALNIIAIFARAVGPILFRNLDLL